MLRLLSLTPATPQTAYFDDQIARRSARVDYKRGKRALGHPQSSTYEFDI